MSGSRSIGTEEQGPTKDLNWKKKRACGVGGEPLKPARGLLMSYNEEIWGGAFLGLTRTGLNLGPRGRKRETAWRGKKIQELIAVGTIAIHHWLGKKLSEGE